MPVAAPGIAVTTRIVSRYWRVAPIGQHHPRLRGTDREDGAGGLQVEIHTRALSRTS